MPADLARVLYGACPETTTDNRRDQLKYSKVVLAAAALAAGGVCAQTPLAPHGIALPPDYRDWRVISVSQRSDSNTMRVIVGNDIAVAAARAGRMNPWPEGAVLGKVVWKPGKDPLWQPATVPAELVHVEFMIRDAKKYPATGNWGYARWRGTDLQPYGKDAGFVQECFGCHTVAKAQDYVFTKPATMP
jgi:hypothetical protein